MTQGRPAVAASEPGEVEADQATATAILTIDLSALTANYRRLAELCAPAECAAVVKADAYGLGMAACAPALARAGCRTFFVATPAEARDLRGLLPEATIYVFDGLLAGTAPILHAHALRPVLNSVAEIKEWAAFCATAGARLPAAIHIDTGMNRLGLSSTEVEALSDAQDVWRAFELTLVISHLACADEPEHPKSEAQRRSFEALRRKLPQALASLANSGGILLGPAYHLDLVRPGIALYGGKPSQADITPFAPVVQLTGRILRVRDVAAGESVGYGASRTLKRVSRIAVLAVGYADGLFRALSADDNREGMSVFLGPHPAPILGRVSMDLITVDVTGIPPHLACRGAFVELIGENIATHQLAAHAGTIDYEVLTSLGPRASRRYIGG
ncbi:MAG: alanine racemase [Methyloceanibacter sp.]